MNFVTVLLTLVLCTCVVSGSPAAIRRDHRRVLINRPSIKEMFQLRVRRSGQQPWLDAGVKGRPYTKPHEDTAIIRKGEYMCGDKVCKLKPGEVPKHCVGCQYPIDISTYLRN